MPKTILIYSDGTGQVGGIRPDQRLSNVYKLYRATRPGPDSPISPKEQVAYYDPGLGAGETGGLSFRRIRSFLAAAVGTGIDENVIDCYAAIIARYEPGDRIALIGFSRGAYTVRSLANVMNLCGVPTHSSDGGPVPRYGPALRKIASDGVRYVYNHGAGHPRKKYEDEREKKAARFRAKYGSEGSGAEGESQGNVQPTFIGVFDTVAALGSRTATIVAFLAVVLFLYVGFRLALLESLLAWLSVPVFLTAFAAILWGLKSVQSQFKYFFEDETKRFRFWNPMDWWAVRGKWHMGWWSGKNFDAYVDREVQYVRHAISIDEARRKFQRVPWGRGKDVKWNNERGHKGWMKQVWFAGNHSDIGGSYPEEESRLSDITLRWMADELVACFKGLTIRSDLFATHPDPAAIQHDEIQNVLYMQPDWLRKLSGNRLTWSSRVRRIHEEADLHPSVLERFEALTVSQMEKVAPYRPLNLREHVNTKTYYS